MLRGHCFASCLRVATTMIALLLLATIVTAAPNEVLIVELAPGVFFRKAQTEPVFTGCNQGWVEFRDFVLVIDANFPGQVKEILSEIRKRTDNPVRYVFDTHYHGDHADGNMRYTEIGAAPIASERSKALFETKGRAGFEQAQNDRGEEYAGLTYAEPTLYFSEKLVIDDGSQRVELLYFGHAHTMGDAVAWLPAHGILFTGDACVNGAFNYTGDSDTASWIAVLSALQELPCKVVAPGHGELSDQSLLEKQKRYFVDLRGEVQSGIDKGRSLDEIKQSIRIPSYKEWTGVDVRQNVENIEHVYKELAASPQSGN